MQSGELDVSGKDRIRIDLHKLPRDVKVRFSDDDCIVPCNPHHRDFVEFEIHATNRHHGGYVLIISWEVTGVRKIKWTAYH